MTSPQADAAALAGARPSTSTPSTRAAGTLTHSKHKRPLCKQSLPPRSLRTTAVASTGGVTVRLQERIPTILLSLGRSDDADCRAQTPPPGDTMKKTVSRRNAGPLFASIGVLTGAHN
jgi:hypothetical protein